MQVWIYTLVSVSLVSLISLIGVVTIWLKTTDMSKITILLVSFAVGALFGDAFIHLLPESYERLGMGLGTSLSVVAGLLIFFILEKIIRWRHCHCTSGNEQHYHPVAILNLVGDSVHNFIDGMLIAASFVTSIPLGIATTIAVVLHEIPQEMGDFGVLVHSGLSVKKALWFNFITALTAVVGAVVVLIFGAYFKGFTTFLLPITAGGFLYIAGSDLIPELHHGCDLKVSDAVKQLCAIVLGVAVMAALTLLEH
jgi:zinc and cadmium transporter